IGHEGIVMHDIRNEHRQLTNREHPMGHSDGSPSNIKPCQNVGGSLEDPNDSDAFDSEDEVMSDSEAPAIAQQPQKCEGTSLHTPLVPLVYPIEPSKQAYFVPFYPHIPQGSTYPFYPPAQYPDCVAPPSALGGADDGEVSSVSQSASQVIPRGSSPPNDDNQGDCCPSTTTTTYPTLVDPTQSPLHYYSTDPTKQML
ncbi:unnamed protein product, partial [Dicrocoelium dendriticum]